MMEALNNPINKPFVILVGAVSAAIFFAVLAALTQL